MKLAEKPAEIPTSTQDFVASLAKKASDEPNSLYALQFSQAALNVANAVRALADAKVAAG